MSGNVVRRLATAGSAVFTTTVFVLVSWPASATADARCGASAASPAATSPSQAARAVTCEINLRRSEHGLRRVRAERKLTRMAQRYTLAMVRQRFFSHVSPGGASMSDRLRASGYGGARWRAGEVLAWGTGQLATPEAVVRSWMASPPHRAVLLGRGYRDVGVGMTPGTPLGAAPVDSGTFSAVLGRTTG
jgi:uncharacterized protein YkwD